jgi:hypothetical protein
MADLKVGEVGEKDYEWFFKSTNWRRKTSKKVKTIKKEI